MLQLERCHRDKGTVHNSSATKMVLTFPLGIPSIGKFNSSVNLGVLIIYCSLKVARVPTHNSPRPLLAAPKGGISFPIYWTGILSNQLLHSYSRMKHSNYIQ